MEDETREVAAVDAELAALGLDRDEAMTEIIDNSPQEEEIQDTPEPEKEPVKAPEKSEVSKKEPNPFKEYKQNLRAELQADFDKKLADARAELAKSVPNEAKVDQLEQDAKELAEKLDFDPEKTKAILEYARKPLTEQLERANQERTTTEARLAAEKEELEQELIYAEEWKTAEVGLKAQFPNASDEQLAVAKDQLDELAHSEKYHEMEIDYILFKEKELFEKTLFSPKKATFESSRPTVSDDSEDFPTFRDDMTPKEFEAFQKSRERAVASIGREKIRVTSRNDRGQVVDRME